MTIPREVLKQDLDKLTSKQLQQVADFIAFLKFQDQRQRHRLVLDSTQLTLLKTEFAEEDRTLAETGMDDYADMLSQEDQ